MAKNTFQLTLLDFTSCKRNWPKKLFESDALKKLQNLKQLDSKKLDELFKIIKKFSPDEIIQTLKNQQINNTAIQKLIPDIFSNKSFSPSQMATFNAAIMMFPEFIKNFGKEVPSSDL